MTDSEISPVNLGLSWLAKSHIRHAKPDAASRGGLNDGYDWVQQRYSFVYSEITGYGISLFVNAYRWTGEASYLTMAQESADFILQVMTLVKQKEHFGAVPKGYLLPGEEPLQQYNSFDAAMCLQGLLDLQRLQPSPDLLGAAEAIGNWLISKMQRNDGAFFSRYDAETNEGHHLGNHFFDDFGCLHAKHAIGLLKLYWQDRDPRFLEAARRVCTWVLTLQDADGAFRATERQPEVVSHAACYAIEGLLYAYADLREERFLQATVRGGEWLKRRQGRNGAIQIGYERRWWRPDRKIRKWLAPEPVSDATAQALRIWLLLYYQTGQNAFLEASRKAASFLRSMQCTHSTDADQLGGFYFKPGHPIQFTWCTLFAVHALAALDQAQRDSGFQKLIEELF
jgi:rhamnogalacturonyl hydrolase YesR